MKLVKGLLLGSAAGLMAIAGAQAAPVEYVKVCSAYGAGFYYIPGTDVCLRVGGYAFIETGYNARVGDAYIYNYAIGDNLILDREDNRVNFRTRGTVILDARAQTAIGTVRTYVAFGADWNNNLNGASAGAVTPYLERAFIQFAGFTAGQAASFFDFGAFYSIYGLSSIAWNWQPVFAYTAQFGNGLSGTISIEDGQAIRTRIDPATFVWGGGTPFPNPNSYGGQQVPDIVANLRVDQTWGSAQISGLLHQLRLSELAAVGLSDGWGWAVLGGIEVKTPMIAPGDSIMLQGVYAKGATEATGISASPLGIAGLIGLKNAAGIGPATGIYDAIGCGPGICGPSGSTGLYLTTAWSANLMFRHFWQPNLRSAFWVGYNNYEIPRPGPASFSFAPDLRIWQAGGNIIWSPAPTLDLSLDVLWTKVEAGACPNSGAASVNNCNISADIWSAWTRWRRNF